MVLRYGAFLATTRHSFADICHTAATCRARLPWWICVERPADLAKAVPSNAAHPGLPPTSGRKVPLPTYTFEAARYWIDTAAAWPASGTPADDRAEHDHSLHGNPLLGNGRAQACTSVPNWRLVFGLLHVKNTK